MSNKSFNGCDIALAEGWLNALLTSYSLAPSRESLSHICHYLDILIDGSKDHLTTHQRTSYCKMKKYWQWRLAVSNT